MKKELSKLTPKYFENAEDLTSFCNRNNIKIISINSETKNNEGFTLFYREYIPTSKEILRLFKKGYNSNSANFTDETISDAILIAGFNYDLFQVETFKISMVSPITKGRILNYVYTQLYNKKLL